MSVTEPINNSMIKYQAYMQTTGWNGMVRDGMTAGTPSGEKRLEAFRIDLSECTYGLKINSISIHLQNTGWQTYTNITPGTVIGTIGESRRLEAIKINCANVPDNKTFQYRVYIEGETSTPDWIDNGAMAGTEGESKRIEAIEIHLIDEE